jgi:cytochrome c1
MNAQALLVWMRTLHPTMPNIAPNSEDLMNVIAYIMSLKDQPDQPGLMVGEVKLGDPQAGLNYAKENCSACHGISDEKSPVAKATRFEEIAHVPGMTATALLVWMRTLHPTMPNLVLDRKDLMDVIAYILILKGPESAPEPN